VLSETAAANADCMACALLRPVIEPSIFLPLESLTVTIPSHWMLQRNVTCKAYIRQVYLFKFLLLVPDYCHPTFKTTRLTINFRTRLVNIILMVTWFIIDLYPMKYY